MRKNIALILALVMILSLIPLTAFAASDNSINRVPVVSEGFEFNDPATAPTLRMEERIVGEFQDFVAATPAPAQDIVFRLNLINADFLRTEFEEWANGDPTDAADLGVTGLSVTRRSASSYNVRVTDGYVFGTPGVISIPLLTEVDEEGEARVEVDPLGSIVSGGTWTFAIVADGDTIARVTGREDVGRGTYDAGTIWIEEASVSALDDTTQEFRLRLPRDVEWADGTTVSFDLLDYDTTSVEFLATVAGVPTWLAATPTVNADEYEITWDPAVGSIPNNGRDLQIRVDITAPSGSRGSIIVDSVITVARGASFGDIAVDLRGITGNISDARNLVIATYVDFGIEVDVDEVIEMYAGRYDADYEVTVEIDTTLDFSLAAGRWIEFQVPSGIAIVEEDSSQNLVRVNNRTFEFLVTDATIDEYEFDFVLVAEGTFVPMGEVSREVEMTISGAGIEETVVLVAEVFAPVTVEVGELTAPFQIGLQRQLAPEITITENFPGAIMEGDIVLSVLDQFAGSMRFDNVDYEVVAGDIEVDDVEIGPGTYGTHEIVIDIDVPSDDEAAVIRLYNIEMTLDRTVPMGPFRLDIGGDALIDYAGPTRSPWGFVERVARFEYFTVGTPVDPTVPVPAQVAFTVGQMAYWVDGEMQMMDVAPFISEGRIMVPVRYMEDLFGMKPIWNPTARTVTVMYNNQVFEMTIGSTMLRVNGAPFMEMDAEATIVDSRTFVPLSRFARAMNIPYVWDAATQTVTFN